MYTLLVASRQINFTHGLCSDFSFKYHTQMYFCDAKNVPRHTARALFVSRRLVILISSVRLQSRHLVVRRTGAARKASENDHGLVFRERRGKCTFVVYIRD